MHGGRFGAVLSIVLATAGAIVTPARAQAPAKTVELHGILDIIRYGGNAPLQDAVDKGYMAANGISLSWDTSKGSQDTISRMASGNYDVGFADMGTLIEFASGNPAKTPRAVFIILDRSPQVILSLKKSPLHTPADLVGTTLVSAATDGASKMFPAFMKANGLSESQVKRNIVDIRLRDPMLARGGADGIIGYDYTSVFNLKGLGTPPEDLSLLYYADNGLNLYGQALLVSQPLLASNPEAVKGFVLAVAHAWRDSIVDPGPAIRAVAALDSTNRVDLETERLKWLNDHEVVTENTRKNGIGSYDPARLQKNIDIVTEGLALARKPALAEIYDDRFVPPLAARSVP
jgi:NitT/TauT family transport system substrate-binding protein